MSNKIRPSRVELIIEIGDESYKINSMNFNDEKKEFFYHFSNPKYLKKKIWNYTLNRYAGVPDHISYHADGTVHLKLKNESNEIDSNMMSDCSFLPINKEM